jgi:malonyl-CoA decarboxylase
MNQAPGRRTPLKLAGLFGFASRTSGASRAVGKTVALCRTLLSTRGEVSGAYLASEILAAYQSMNAKGGNEPARSAFFDSLIREFSPDPEKVGAAGEAYRKEPSPQNLARLQFAAEPPRQELFRRLNMAPGGMKALIEMRARLLREIDQNPLWEPIAADLTHLLTSWFNRGFLALRRIDWNSSAIILEKLIQHEAVHQIQGWDDLRRRLAADRRCYGFFHPALPDEPVIFIEAALTRGMSATVQPLLDPDAPVSNPESADCAMFYSITNCQDGLRGVPLGSFLIKQVVEDLGREFPRLRKFATVSPVPGFRRWISENVNTHAELRKDSRLADLAATLEKPDWVENREVRTKLQRDLVALCAYYLLHAKQGKDPLDPVARFHLRNGARLERINWLGDTSETGMRRSAGLMTNYVYRLADVERNHEFYTREYKVTASREIEGLAKQSLMISAVKSSR